MLTFTKRLALFAIISFTLINVFTFLFPFSQHRRVAAEEIMEFILRSNLPTSASVLLIGDSVARQLELGAGHPDWLDLSSNQAISLAGQYVIAKNVLDNNPSIEKIILVYHPRSFRNNLDQKFTFNYFCKPFCYPENRNTWESSVSESLESKPVWLTYFPVVRYTSLFGELDFSKENSTNDAYMSLVSYDYIINLNELAEEHNIEFYIIGTPVSTYYDSNIDELKESIDSINIENMFMNYWASIYSLNNSKFRDHIHLVEEEISEARNNIIDDIESIIDK